jgi:hypothetical protein
MTISYQNELKIAKAQDQLVVAGIGILGLTFPYSLYGKLVFPHLGAFDSSPYNKFIPNREILDAAMGRFEELKGSYQDLCRSYVNAETKFNPAIKNQAEITAVKKQAAY